MFALDYIKFLEKKKKKEKKNWITLFKVKGSVSQIEVALQNGDIKQKNNNKIAKRIEFDSY